MPTKKPENKRELPRIKASPSSKDLTGVYRYSGMAVKMAVVICVGVFGGQYIDESMRLETPWFTLFLSLAGVAMAIVVVVRDTKPR